MWEGCPGMLLAIAAMIVNPADPWAWLTDTISAQSIFQLLGGGVLVVLFATGRIVTIGQLRRELAALSKHHDAEMDQAEAKYNLMIAETDRRYSELREQRDYWQNTADRHDQRATKATEQLVEMNELAKLGVHALTSFEEAASLERGKST
jgi:hypothetical protein